MAELEMFHTFLIERDGVRPERADKILASPENNCVDLTIGEEDHT